jgi:hypothetical protein
MELVISTSSCNGEPNETPAAGSDGNIGQFPPWVPRVCCQCVSLSLRTGRGLALPAQLIKQFYISGNKPLATDQYEIPWRGGEGMWPRQRRGATVYSL